MKKSINIQTLITLIILLLPAILHAQLILPPNPDNAPIDGGLSLLIAGGVGYGIKKLRENKNKPKENNR